MGWSRHGSGFRRRGYHHGNLREDLIRAAPRPHRRQGSRRLHLAEAARAAGVSPAAPYRHFRDRDASSPTSPSAASRALPPYWRLPSITAGPIRWQRWKRSGAPISPLRVASRRSMRQCVRRPAFRPMPRRAAAGRRPSLRCPAPGRRGALPDIAGAGSAARPDDEPAHLVARSWHRLLVARTDNAGRTTPMSAEDLLEAGVLVYLEGLGITAGVGA